MKKRYYLSMLSAFPLIMVFNSIYFIFHKSFDIFLMMGLMHLSLYGLLNFWGTYHLFKPIDKLFNNDGDIELAKQRVDRLNRLSTGWIFIIGTIFTTVSVLPLFIDPSVYGDIEVFTVEKMPMFLILSGIPATLFIFAIFPAFIIYFLINDFKMDLKSQMFARFGILYPAGKRQIGMMFLVIFIIIVFIPALLAILELAVTLELGDKYAQFSTLNPLESVMIDRLVVLFGVITSVIFLKRAFTKPIDSLLTEIDKVRAGDYSTRTAIITEDEIGVLTNNFNEMVQELESSHQKLAAQNHTLEIKVDARTRELKEKNIELENTLNTLQQMQKQIIVQEKMASLGQLVAGLTHEINTPLGVIRSMKNTQSKAVARLKSRLENLPADRAASDSEIQKMMQIILNADQSIDQGTERLGGIIQNLKTFARLDEAETAVADIHESMDSVLALIKHDLLTNIEVVREYGDVPPFVCHARKLNQVFFNLLKNACQAIENSGRITITTKVEDNHVFVAIRDTGKGIKPEDLDAIFDPGFSKKGAVVRASMGLSISYQIIQEHNGRIEVASKPGEGSVFTVVIPTAI